MPEQQLLFFSFAWVQTLQTGAGKVVAGSSNPATAAAAVRTSYTSQQHFWCAPAVQTAQQQQQPACLCSRSAACMQSSQTCMAGASHQATRPELKCSSISLHGMAFTLLLWTITYGHSQHGVTTRLLCAGCRLVGSRMRSSRQQCRRSKRVTGAPATAKSVTSTSRRAHTTAECASAACCAW
jgi:hypothetical protein